MIKLAIISYFLFAFSCQNAEEEVVITSKIRSDSIKQELKIQDETDICLSYKFPERFPYLLRFSKNSIYVGDGKHIYKFNYKGEFNKKFNIHDKIDGFVDFDINESNNEVLLYCTWEGKVNCFKESGQIIYSIEGGDMVRVDDNGNAYTSYQEYDNTKDQIINKIKVISSDGTGSDYPTISNIASLNYEIVENKIMMHTSDNTFYNLPLVSNEKESSFNLPINEERVWFLGKLNNYYVFRTFDFDNKKDILHFYDSSLKKVKEKLLDVSFDDVVIEQRKDENFLMDNPSAIIYSFFNGEIYYLRNTNRGSCISKLRI